MSSVQSTQLGESGTIAPRYRYTLTCRFFHTNNPTSNACVRSFTILVQSGRYITMLPTGDARLGDHNGRRSITGTSGSGALGIRTVRQRTSRNRGSFEGGKTIESHDEVPPHDSCLLTGFEVTSDIYLISFRAPCLLSSRKQARCEPQNIEPPMHLCGGGCDCHCWPSPWCSTTAAGKPVIVSGNAIRAATFARGITRGPIDI